MSALHLQRSTPPHRQQLGADPAVERVGVAPLVPGRRQQVGSIGIGGSTSASGSRRAATFAIRAAVVSTRSVRATTIAADSSWA